MKDKIDIDTIIDPGPNLGGRHGWAARGKATNFAIINKWLKLRKARLPGAGASAEDKPSAEICASSITKMDLNGRILMRLMDMNIHTLGDIIRFPAKELKTSNFGHSSIGVLQRALDAYGAKLPTVSDLSADIFRVTPDYVEAGLYNNSWSYYLFIITPKSMTVHEEQIVLTAIRFEHRKIITK